MSVNGVRLHYVDLGNTTAAPVILIHGFPMNHEMWNSQLEVLKEEGFRVIAYDLRGHGGSDVGDGQYFLEFFVDDLIRLLDHLKIKQAIVCGLSIGGYIALRAIERNPEHFRALVLCDTQPRADTNEAKLKRAANIKLVKKEGVEPFAENFVKSLFAPQAFLTNMVAVEAVRNMIQSNSPLGICGTLLALATRTDTTSALRHIRVPTLILVGEQDALTPPSLSQEMHSEIPNSELHVISNAAHLSPIENSEEFNKHLISFLQRSTK